MDVLTELLPPSYLLKSESTEKDKRRNKKGYSNKLSKKLETTKESTEIRKVLSQWDETDRRSGNDRRKQFAKRGRWLESRDRNDRRAVITDVFVKI